MQTLLDISLSCLKANFNDILMTNPDSLLKMDIDLLLKLSNKFSNYDLEEVRLDSEDETSAQHVVMNLFYCRLIYSLASVVPEKEKGHFWSMHDFYKCKHCKRLVPACVSHRVSCVSGRFTVVHTGEIVNTHEMDVGWDLMKHLNNLKSRYACNWRRIYWRVWSECHHLICAICGVYYPVIDPTGCRRHGIEPVYSFIDEEGISTKMHPIGWFSCCNAKAYRYQSVPHMKDIKGCRILNHEPLLSKTRKLGEREPETYGDDIIRIKKILKQIISYDDDDDISVEPENDSTTIEGKLERQNSATDNVGLVQREIYVLKNSNTDSISVGKGDCLTSEYPVRPLSKRSNSGRRRREFNTANKSSNYRNHNLVNTAVRLIKNRSKVTISTVERLGSDDTLYNEGCCLPMQDINMEEKYFNKPIQYTKRTNKHKKMKCGLQSDQWVSRFSTRYNQDRQREYEDQFFKFANTVLSKRAEGLKMEERTKVGDMPASTGEWGSNENSETMSKTNLLNSTSSKEVLSDSSDDINESAPSESSSSYCSTLNSSVRVRHSRTTSVWNSHTPLAGSYVRIETEHRDVYYGNRSGANEGELKRPIDNTLLTRLNSRVSGKNNKPPTFTVQHHLYNRKYAKMSIRTEFPAIHSVTKTKILEIPLLKDRNAEDYFNIWSFDAHSQELDYLSAAYMPLPVTFNTKFYKYFKTIRNELANEWDDLVDLEKSWDAFLCLFFENELLPSNSDRLCVKSIRTIDRMEEQRMSKIDETDPAGGLAKGDEKRD